MGEDHRVKCPTRSVSYSCSQRQDRFSHSKRHNGLEISSAFEETQGNAASQWTLPYF